MSTAWLPRFLRWMFAIFSVFAAIAAVTLIVILLIDPSLPSDTKFGPLKADIEGVPATVSMRDSTFVLNALNGAILITIHQADGFIETLKHHGLPLLILNSLFFMVFFDLMRRLFRNVGRGESFTQQTVQLVQIIGVSLLVFSLVSAAAESWFHVAIFSYLVDHSVVAVSGTPIRLPSVGRNITIDSSGAFPFGSPIFFTGLLVLALSEVFRQGLVLKRENDLTV